MEAIFSGIKEIASQFISSALENDISLRYYGKEVHSTYELAKICTFAQDVTKDGSFKLHYMMNYSFVQGCDEIHYIVINHFPCYDRKYNCQYLPDIK